MRRFDPEDFPDLAVSILGGRVLHVVLDRPHKKNAIGVDMTLSLERVFQRLESTEQIKVVVIEGAGGNFSAGMDMRDFFSTSDRAPEQIARARQATDHWRARQIRNLRQSLYCVVRGYCLGGALPLVEAADWSVATDDAIFGLPEINFNFVPGGPIAKSIGLGMSAKGGRYAALSGRNFSAQQALQWGLINEISPSNDASAHVINHALQLAAVQAG
jgi:enoyl-CoA hydratase/carnithine racemase